MRWLLRSYLGTTVCSPLACLSKPATAHPRGSFVASAPCYVSTAPRVFFMFGIVLQLPYTCRWLLSYSCCVVMICERARVRYNFYASFGGCLIGDAAPGRLPQRSLPYTSSSTQKACTRSSVFKIASQSTSTNRHSVRRKQDGHQRRLWPGWPLH